MRENLNPDKNLEDLQAKAKAETDAIREAETQHQHQAEAEILREAAQKDPSVD